MKENKVTIYNEELLRGFLIHPFLPARWTSPWSLRALISPTAQLQRHFNQHCIIRELCNCRAVTSKLFTTLRGMGTITRTQRVNKRCWAWSREEASATDCRDNGGNYGKPNWLMEGKREWAATAAHSAEAAWNSCRLVVLLPSDVPPEDRLWAADVWRCFYCTQCKYEYGDQQGGGLLSQRRCCLYH